MKSQTVYDVDFVLMGRLEDNNEKIILETIKWKGRKTCFIMLLPLSLCRIFTEY